MPHKHIVAACILGLFSFSSVLTLINAKPMRLQRFISDETRIFAIPICVLYDTIGGLIYEKISINDVLIKTQ